MSFKAAFALSTLALFAAAAPWQSTTTTSTWGTTTTSTWGTTTTSTPTSTWGTTPTTTPASTWTTTTAASPTPTSNNGQQFLNQCENLGISVLDCTELGNIAALNGNSIVVGATSSPSSGSSPINNGQQFINQCKNYGISIADCAELLNIAILNGNTIDISLAGLTAIISSLGLSPTILSGISIPVTGLITVPTGIL